jgi:GR25 family glycosyltransferase involved in LPS biosynthesis
MAGAPIQLCIITTMAGVTKGRAETIRRNFYRLMESWGWLTPLGWIMDSKTCSEAMEKLQHLASEFAKETNGKQLFYLATTLMSYSELKRLMQYAKEPENKEVAMRLKKILELQRQLVELTT